MTPKDKLARLREEWKQNPDRRDTIELQARIVKMATTSKEEYTTPKEKEDNELAMNVAETLL